MKIHLLSKKSKRVQFREEEEAFKRAIKTDNKISMLYLLLILLGCFLYWFVFFSLAVKITPFVYRIFS